MLGFALRCCRQFHVETEPIQLLRLLLHILRNGSDDGEEGRHHYHRDKAYTYSAYLEDVNRHNVANTQFDIQKYHKLRAVVKGQTDFFGRGKNKDET
jgi:hypothetical protein